MNMDFHAHFDSAAPESIKTFVETCERNQCRTVIVGGMRYGDFTPLPNDEVIKLCRNYSEWLIPMVQVDLWDTAPDLAELRRLVDLGAKGVKCIYPYYAYDHDLYMDMYEECEKLGVPILFHTGKYRPSSADTVWRRPLLKNMDPLNLDRIARSFQKLNMVMAHLGSAFWRIQAAELLKTHDNLYADLGGCGNWQMLSAEELVTLLRPPLFLCKDTARFFRKLVFGSDSYITFPDVQTRAKIHYEQILAKIGASEDLKKAIMGETVRTFFGA